ncbi:MAG: hypothetical protein DHS20C15_10780 [Planctomycetota bacterium]|nr:MAG: hypothetical protein DHS20C15_10780 [Planctomycetota bacterium]
MLALAKELHLGVKSHSSNLAKGTEGILRAAWAEELEEDERRAKAKAKKAAAAAASEEEAEPAKPEAAEGGGGIGISVTVRTGGDAAEPVAEAPSDDQAVAPAEPAADDAAPVETAAASHEDSDAAAPAPAEAADDAPVAAASSDEAAPEAPAENDAAAEAPVAAPEAAADDTSPEPVAAAEEPASEPAAASASSEAPAEEADDAQKKTVSLTFGGEAPHSDPEEDDDAESKDDAADSKPADAAAKSTDDKGKPSKPEVRQIGVVNVPTRRADRKGAKILGKIDLKPKPPEPSSDRSGRRGGQQSYDPLDPTRAMPAARGRPGAGGGAGERRGDGDSQKKGGGRGGKGGGGGDFVFDAEDSGALAAIRLGHFGNRRRPQVRRPPTRRSRIGGGRRARKPVVRPTHPITVRPPIGVRELSEELGIKAREILMTFPEVFDPRDKNAVLDADQLIELGISLDREITLLDPDTAESRMLTSETERTKAAGGEAKPRPPVVTVMGHVDHGKTTLLDTLRSARVAAKEAGGITQKTSAYSVQTKSGATVTFLDTPGHRAFTEMRSRGAQVTDVALVVVAADDGVMEQTQEALDHAQAAEVPLVIAINKIDKNNADPMKVRQQLASAGILVEDYGGDIGVVEISATSGKGLDELVERLALETELLELKANPKVPARGVVIDSRKDKSLGIVATVVVQSGTLRAKDPILAGTTAGRVRWLLDSEGKRVKEATPSMPVQVVGFEEPPAAGASFLSVSDINVARSVAAERLDDLKDDAVPTAAVDAVTLDNLFDTIDEQNVTEINVLLKADNMGSLDVVKQTVEEVTHDEVRFKVIRNSVGGITEDDILLASASEAFIIGFGVVPDNRARAAIQRTGVDVKFYEIIYEMTEDLEKALEGQLGTERVEEVTGHAEIRAIFKASRYGNIAGCYVTDGTMNRDSHIRLVRDGKVVHTGKLDSLKRFKDDIKEVRENYECGLHLHNYNDIREGDVLEAFNVTEVKRTLESTAKKD